MNKSTFWSLLTLLLVTFSAQAQTDFTDSFNNGSLSTNWWASSGQYTLSESAGTLRVDVNKNQAWRSFGIFLPNTIDISMSKLINVKVKASSDITLSIYIVDAQNINKPVTKRISKAENFASVCFDYTNFTGIDFATISKLYIAINGSGLTYKGTVYFDDLKVGTAAERLSNFSGVADQTAYQGTTKNTILVRNVENAQSLSFAGTPTLIENITISPVSAGAVFIEYDAKQSVSGTQTITLVSNPSSGFVSNSFAFQLTVEGNLPPAFDVAGSFKCKVGTNQTIPITNITDGNGTVIQPLSFSINSDKPNVIGADAVFDYVQQNRIASLRYKPTEAGIANATITLNDGQTTNNIATKQITVQAYNEWNEAPTLNAISSRMLYNNAGEQTIALTGISDGDNGSQQLIFDVAVSETDIISTPVITYTSGGTGTLKFSPIAGKTGNVTLTITVTDNGGNANNNGNGSVSQTFTVDVQSAPLTGFKIPFVDLATDRENKVWKIETDSVTQTIEYIKEGAEDVLLIDCKSKTTWTGLWYLFNNRKLDLLQHPYITLWVKSDQNILFHLYFWDYKGLRNNMSPTEEKTIPANTWTKVTYDFFGRMKTGAGVPLAADIIESVLFNYHPDFTVPVTNWTGKVWVKDIRIGDQADGVFDHPRVCTLNDIPNITKYAVAGQGTVGLSNLTDGIGGNATATAVSSNTGIVANPTIVNNGAGKATLTYNLTGTVGTATITVTGTAANAGNVVKTFTISTVAANPAAPSNITIEINTKFQTMMGIGAFVDNSVKPYLKNYTDDFGATVARIGVIGNQLEPTNDNNNPFVLNRSALNYNAFDWDMIKQLQNKGVEHFILSIWSVPAWMKDNASESAATAGVPNWTTTDNRVDTLLYDEYAEYALALALVFKEKTGKDLYGIGLQNEPTFNEPYPSAILPPKQFVKLINMVGRRFRQEGVNCKLYMAEQVMAQNASMYEYLNALKADNEAWQYCDIKAIHGYAGDGITAYSANCTEWNTLKNSVKEAPHPKQLWVTETELKSATWADMISNLGAMSTAFSCGDVNLWTQWGYVANFTLQGQNNQLPYAQSQFAKFARPGSVRVSATTDNTNLMVNTFVNTKKYNKEMATVVINKSATPISIKLTGVNIPTNYSVYQTYNLNNFKSETAAQKDVAYLLPAQSITTFVAPLPNAAPTIDPIEDRVIPNNGAEQMITITGITDGDEGTQPLTVTASITSGATVISNVRIDYSSPNNTAKMYYTPINNQAGNAVIKVEVADDGVVNNKTSIYANIKVLATTSVVEVTSLNFSIYPTITQSVLNLKLPDNTFKSAMVINAMGQVVMQASINSLNEVINIHKLRSGIYSIIVKNDKEHLTKKFIVK